MRFNIFPGGLVVSILLSGSSGADEKSKNGSPPNKAGSLSSRVAASPMPKSSLSLPLIAEEGVGSGLTLKFSPNSKFLAARDAKTRTVYILSVESGKIDRKIVANSKCGAQFCFGPDSESIFVETDLGKIERIQLRTAKPNTAFISEEIKKRPLIDLDVSPDMKHLGACYRRGACIWSTGDASLRTVQRSVSPAAAEYFGNCFFSSDSKKFHIFVRNRFEAWDVNSLMPDAEVELEAAVERGAHNWARSKFVSPSSLPVESKDGGDHGMIRCWTVDGKSGLEGRTHSERATKVCFTPDDKVLIVAGTDRLSENKWSSSIVVYEVASGKCLKVVNAKRKGFIAIACSPNGQYFATAEAGSPIELTNLVDFLMPIHPEKQ